LFLKSLSFVLLSAISTISGIILFPLFIKYLEPVEFGYYSLIVSCTALATLLSGLGLYNGMSNFYFDFESDERKKLLNNLFSGSAVLNLILASVFAIIIFLLGIYDFKISTLLSLAIVLGFADSLNALFFQFLRNEGKNKRFLVLSTISIITNLVITSAMLFFGWGLWSAVLGKLMVSGVLMVLIALRYIRFEIDQSFLKPIMKYGVKLVPVLLFGWVFQFSDRFLAEYFLIPQVFGNFGFVISASALIMTGFLAIGNSIQPELYFAFKEENNQQVGKVVRHYILLILAGAFVGLAILWGIHTYWAGFKYYDSIPALVLYAGGFFLLAFQHLYNMELIYLKKVRVITIYQNLSYASYSILLFGIFSVGYLDLMYPAYLFFGTRILIMGFYFVGQMKSSKIIFSNKKVLILSQILLVALICLTYFLTV
tara:strand:+ start:413 stop:1693 length:1281 start_codon:yes stop_codon:yes gene_type:complete